MDQPPERGREDVGATPRVFIDEAVSRGVAYTAMGKAYAGMGIGLGDVDNDGLLDLFVTHLGSETNTLWRQGPRGGFRDRTSEAGLADDARRGTGFGVVAADFDNDGSLDLAVVNGRVIAGGAAKDTGLGFWETYAERNQLFANDGTGKFRDISAANAGVLRRLERRVAAWPAPTSRGRGRWACSSTRPAAAPGSSATSPRIGGTGCRCAPSIRS